MDRIVVISTNNNPDYFFYAPYMEKAWNSFGWRLAIVVTHDVSIEDLKLNPKGNTIVIKLPNIDGIRLETQAQAGRLYACNHLPENCIVMTSDMDLLPLSNYWNPSINDVTIYGYDLTWRSFFPMGYCAMSRDNWIKYLNLTGDTEKDFLRDANDRSVKHDPYSSDWSVYWDYDWDLLTTRLSPFKDQLTFIDRGQIDIAGATLAKGRIDRYNWEVTQSQPEPFIDAHCENNNTQHPVKLEPFLKVFTKYHGEL
jgi:hypothetical protein